MISSILYISCIVLSQSSTTLALTLQLIQNASSSTPSSASTNETFPGPVSLTLDDPAVAQDYPDPVCNGDLLGFDMDPLRCLEAWRTMPQSYKVQRFGERFARTFDFDVLLPRRFSSRKSVVRYSPVDCTGASCSRFMMS